jgi:hypothetical protein
MRLDYGNEGIDYFIVEGDVIEVEIEGEMCTYEGLTDREKQQAFTLRESGKGLLNFFVETLGSKKK